MIPTSMIFPLELHDFPIALELDKLTIHLPNLFQTSSKPQVTLRPSPKFSFVIYATPVGDYFSTGAAGAKMKVERTHDRAAGRGQGWLKMGGNYAPCFRFVRQARGEGFTDVLYMDAKTGEKVGEMGPRPFIFTLFRQEEEDL